MSRVEKKYECGSCYELHDSEDRAHECCPPKVTEVFVCTECDSDYKSLHAALECCPPEDGDSTEPSCNDGMFRAELERAGQLRLGI